VIDHLPSKREALSSNPSTTKNKQTNKKKPRLSLAKLFFILPCSSKMEVVNTYVLPISRMNF
jgi:hypothetical protein